MGFTTVTVYADSRREVASIEKDAGEVLTEAGAVITSVKVIELTGNHAKVRFEGDMKEVIEGSSMEDLVCELWVKVGGYCWVHICVNDGDETVQEKFDRGDYKELIG